MARLKKPYIGNGRHINTTEQDLQYRLEGAESLADTHRRNWEYAQEQARRSSTLLTNLLALDPSLERFRITTDDGWGEVQAWDHEGIAAAVEHLKNRDLAARFTKKENN